MNHILDHLPPSLIKNREHHFREVNSEAIDNLAEWHKKIGVPVPIIVDRHDRLVRGDEELQAAKKANLQSVPVVRITDINEGQLRAYALACINAESQTHYDDEELAKELGDIVEQLGEPVVDDLGFEPAYLDRVLGFTELKESKISENIPNVDPNRALSKPGDKWLIGEHILLCDDALNSASYSALMADDLAQLVLSDGPYNLSAKSISGNGQFKHQDFVQAAGEMDSAQFTRFLTAAMRNMKNYSHSGSLHMLFMSWHHLLELLRAGHIVYDELKNIVTWVKKQGGQGALYRSQTEFVAIFKNGTDKHINNIQMGKFGRNRTNAWFYDGMNTANKGRNELLALHPTVKPIDLLADAILDASNKDDIILDPFVGSGSTIIAAHKVGRRARAMELDPLYVDVALRRIFQETGIDPVRASDGQPLSQLEAQFDKEIEIDGEAA